MPKYANAEAAQRTEQARREAQQFLAAPQHDSAAAQALANRLADVNELGYARKVLEAADFESLDKDSPLRLDILRRRALFTSKDAELPANERLQKAEQMVLALLPQIPDTAREQRNDCYGLLGSIYKQRWQIYGLREHLERSYRYYRLGMEQGLESDAERSCAVNAAFVLDLLAQTAEGDGAALLPLSALRNQAEEIRRRVIAFGQQLPPASKLRSEYWFLCTMGEASLGIGDYAQARHWYALAAQVTVSPWKLETAARQLAHMVRLQALKEKIPEAELEQSPAWPVLQALLGGDAVGAGSFLRGKVGLALSGGGFRASLFHIGVLARLAELDMLRHIEVISCVSGGSIVGAYYYLKLKQLLESKSDAAIERDDYIRIVHEMECEFLAGVQRNLRMRMLAGFRSNLTVFRSAASSMTNRLADLYERELYAKVTGKREMFMDDLIIKPDGADFYPRYDNWKRAAKVPILVLNATTLNTCHNWQFTATFMGEPPERSIEKESDANDRLRRLYYKGDDTPPAYQSFRLGYAVAASACVPGLFEPLALDDLYQQGYVPRLVDGGVFDNQGIAGLQEQDCTVLLVSDASGQTGTEKEPADSRPSVLFRSNSVLMARVRQCEYQNIAALRDTGLLRGAMYVHLKKDLEASSVDWLGCSDPSKPASDQGRTSYLMRKDVQRQLAAIRTDLDSFSDAESDALMLSGYLMTDGEFFRSIMGFPVNPATASVWRFIRIAPIAQDTTDGSEVKELKHALDVAHFQDFKPLRLSGVYKAVSAMVALAVLGLALWAAIAFWNTPLHLRPAAQLVSGLAVLVLAAAGVQYALARLFNYHNSMLQIIASAVMCLVGWLLLELHLRFFEPVYLRWGAGYRNRKDAVVVQMPSAPGKLAPAAAKQAGT